MSRFNFVKKGGRKYLAWKNWQVGEYLVGKYTKSYEDQFGNENYEVQIIEAEIEGADLKEGDLFGVNSCGSLKHNMTDVAPGSYIQVTYEGKGEIEKGPFKDKSFHKVGLEVDDSGVAEVINDVQDEEIEEGEVEL